MAWRGDGSADYISDTGNAAVSSLPFSIVGLANADGTTEDCIGSVGYGSGNDGARLFTTSAGANIRMKAQGQDGSGANSANSGIVSTGAWQYGAAVFNSSGHDTAYVNGAPGSETTTNTLTPTLDRTAIGAKLQSGAAQYFDGAIAYVGYYSIELSQAEVSQLAAGISPELVRRDSLAEFVDLRREFTHSTTGATSLTSNGSPTVDPHPHYIRPRTAQYPAIIAAAPTGGPRNALGHALKGPFGGPVG